MSHKTYVFSFITSSTLFGFAAISQIIGHAHLQFLLAATVLFCVSVVGWLKIFSPKEIRLNKFNLSNTGGEQ